MELKPRQNAVANAILADMREIFGQGFYNLLTTKIARDYLNDKVDIRTAIIKYPSVFEQAFIGLIGPLGEKFLANVCENVQHDLGLDDSIRYSKVGDFAKYITVVNPV